MKTTSLKGRIAKLEKRFAKLGANEPQISELWVDRGDGILRHRDGRSMTREEFETAFPDARKITLKIFDKELVHRHPSRGDNANSETEGPRKYAS